MIYLLILEEHPFDMCGKVKTKIKGYTDNKKIDEKFVAKNDNFNFGKYIYKEVKKYNP